jgi:hypothetical protein
MVGPVGRGEALQAVLQQCERDHIFFAIVMGLDSRAIRVQNPGTRHGILPAQNAGR